MPNYGPTIKIGGDWKAFSKFLKYTWRSDFDKIMNKATERSARYLLSQIRERIRNKEYQINKLSTAIKKGFKTASEATPLVDTGGLIAKGMVVNQLKNLVYEVGVLANHPMDERGKKAMEIVPVLHDGATITQTRGSKRVTIRIPPRPFLKEVFEDDNVIKKVEREWHKGMEYLLKKHGKL